jgi:hypothetical protein
MRHISYRICYDKTIEKVYDPHKSVQTDIVRGKQIN